MDITMDDAVTSWVKHEHHDAMVATGWVLVVSTADGKRTGAPNGVVIMHSADLAQHVQQGLLQTGLNSILHDQLFSWLGERKNPKPPSDNPPF